MQTGRNNPIFAIVIAIASVAFCKFFIIDLAITKGQSMAPSLNSGSIVVVFRLAYGLRIPWQRAYLFVWGSPRVGQIVSAFSPEDNSRIVKRVASIQKGIELRGDNASLSHDSRSFGRITLDAIEGRILF